MNITTYCLRILEQIAISYVTKELERKGDSLNGVDICILMEVLIQKVHHSAVFPAASTTLSTNFLKCHTPI